MTKEVLVTSTSFCYTVGKEGMVCIGKLSDLFRMRIQQC